MNCHRPHATRLALAALAPFTLIALAVGCGGAPSVTSGGADAPVNYQGAPLETAANDLTRYEDELRMALGPTPDGAYAEPGAAKQPYAQPPGQYPAPTATAAGDATQGGAAAPPPPPAGKPEREAKAAEVRASAPAEPGQLGSDPCAIACRALASMDRAASHICDIAGASDERCENAKGRVKHAEDRVHAACRGCG